MIQPHKILITGATGFIGSTLYTRLRFTGHDVVGTSRRKQDTPNIFSMDLHVDNWSPALYEVSTVVHCAAIAHVECSTNTAFINKVRELNIAATLRLAKQAKQQRVKRFIFLSSIKALGESTQPHHLYNHQSEYSPEDLYGESKRDAELALKEELLGSDTDLVIIRPPLVYGPGVKGNFRALMGISKRNLPLPFKTVDNRRSLVALDNLVDLIITCVKYPESLNETFLVSDDHDVSTRELLEALSWAYGKQSRLMPFPVSLMRTAARVFGKKSVADRLFGNLQLDISHTKRTLNWQPKVSFEQAIRDCVESDVSTSN